MDWYIYLGTNEGMSCKWGNWQGKLGESMSCIAWLEGVAGSGKTGELVTLGKKGVDV